MQDVLNPRSRVFFRAYSVYQIAANLSPRYLYPQALLPFYFFSPCLLPFFLASPFHFPKVPVAGIVLLYYRRCVCWCCLCWCRGECVVVVCIYTEFYLIVLLLCRRSHCLVLGANPVVLVV